MQTNIWIHSPAVAIYALLSDIISGDFRQEMVKRRRITSSAVWAIYARYSMKQIITVPCRFASEQTSSYVLEAEYWHNILIRQRTVITNYERFYLTTAAMAVLTEGWQHLRQFP